MPNLNRSLTGLLTVELLLDPAAWASFVALTALEVVLGIDNVIFLSIVTEKLNPVEAKRARQLGLTLALVFRIVLLLAISWIIGMTAPLFSVFGTAFSTRDL